MDERVEKQPSQNSEDSVNPNDAQEERTRRLLEKLKSINGVVVINDLMVEAFPDILERTEHGVLGRVQPDHESPKPSDSTQE